MRHPKPIQTDIGAIAPTPAAIFPLEFERVIGPHPLADIGPALLIAAGFNCGYLYKVLQNQAARVKERPAYYVLFGDEGTIYCEKHANTYCKKLLSKDPDGGYEVCVTAWEEDGLPLCQKCGILLGEGQSLTKYGAEQEMKNHMELSAREIWRSPLSCYAIALAARNGSPDMLGAVLAARLAWWKAYRQELEPDTVLAVGMMGCAK